METGKINLKDLSFSKIIRSWKSAAKEGANPDTQWVVTVVVTILTALSIGAFGALTYLGTFEEEFVPTPTKRDKTYLSMNELRDVIALYEKRSTAFRELERYKPDVSGLGRGSGVATPIVITTEAAQEISTGTPEGSDIIIDL